VDRPPLLASATATIAGRNEALKTRRRFGPGSPKQMGLSGDVTLGCLPL